MIRFYVDLLSSSQILVEPFTSERNCKALLFNGGISLLCLRESSGCEYYWLSILKEYCS